MNPQSIELRVTAKNLASKVLSGVLGSISGVGKSLGGIGAVAGVAGAAVVGAFAVIAAQGLKLATTFEAQISKVTAITGGGKEALSALALQLGRDTKYSALEAAQGIEELVKAGVTMKQVLSGAARGALNLAAAGSIEVSKAAEIAATALNSFKFEALNMTKAADILAGAANNSAADVSTLATSLKYVASTAGNLKVPFKDVNTALAILSNRGMKGSTAGTSLNNFLQNLNPSTNKALDALAKLNVEFFNAKGNLLPLPEIIKRLDGALKGMTAKDKQRVLIDIFNVRGARAAMSLLSEGTKGFKEMANAITKVSAADVAKEKLNNLAGAMKFLRSTWDTKLIEIFQKPLPGLKDLVWKINNLISAFDTGAFLQSIAKLADKINAFLQPAIKFLSENLAGAFNELKPDILELAKNFGELWVKAQPVLKVIGIGLVVVLGALIKTIIFLSTWIIKIGLAFQNHMIKRTTATYNAIEKLIGWIKSVIEWFKRVPDAVGSFMEAVKNKLGQAGQWIGALFNSIKTAVGGFISSVISAFVGFGMAVYNTLNNMVKINGMGIVDFFALVFQGVLVTLATWGGAIINFFTQWWNEIVIIFEGVKAVVMAVFVVIGTWISARVNEYKGYFYSFVGFLSGIWNTLKTGAIGAFSAIASPIVVAFNRIKDTISGVLAAIQKNITAMITGVAKGGSNMADGFKKMLNGVIDGINKTLEFKFKVAGNTIEINMPDIPRLAKGTPYVARDGLAFLHKGEAVVPAKANANNKTAQNTGKTVNITNNNYFEKEVVDPNVIANKLAFQLRGHVL